jgi:Uma2 family endonuclease
MEVEIERHRFGLAEYHAMIEYGILTERDRVELIAGEILEKMTIGDRHIGCVNALTHFFSKLLGDRAVVAVQQPVAIPPNSEPEPDISLLRPRKDFYGKGRPYPKDVLLLVEVADSSLRFDRLVKLPIYAKAGIVEVWIVDVVGKTVQTYSDPTESGYSLVRIARGDDALSPSAFPDVTFTASEILDLDL